MIALGLTLLNPMSRAWGHDTDDPPELHLEVSIENQHATATLRIPPGEAREYRIDGLQIQSIHATPPATDWQRSELRLRIPPSDESRVIEIAYRFEPDPSLGWLETGATLTWPDGCARLFPCDPHPSKGLDFELHITDIPSGDVVIHAERLGHPGPAYQLAWASGPYLEHPLGETQSGRRVSIWATQEDQEVALLGSTHLVQIIDWLETTLGPYPYGNQLGAVVVPRTPGMVAMEHHPFWHVSAQTASSEVTHAHEAAHAWYGNGIRLACWEDFVLSEGVASYLAAKGIGGVLGPEEESKIWSAYRARLFQAEARHTVPVLPDSCTLESATDGGLYSSLSYMRGAWFFRAVEELIGEEVLFEALQSFYGAHHGTAVRMRDLIAHIEAQSHTSIDALVTAWLTSESAQDRQRLLEAMP